jgi:hypothetical protein
VALSFAFTVGRIAAINMIADPKRIAELELIDLDDQPDPPPSAPR